MRILLFNDLHLEFADFTPPKTTCDVVVLAGDTDRKLRGVRWASETFPETPIVYVFGNHKYYTGAIPSLVEKAKDEATKLRNDLFVLDRDVVRIGDVTFLGCTLWTDFTLNCDQLEGMDESRRRMTDYKKIRVSPDFSRLRPQYLAAIHRRDVEWLRTASSEVASKKVVVTHHAPSARSVAPPHTDDSISASYASNLDDLVESAEAELWVHGHTHWPVRYQLGETTVISNPRGYPDEDSSRFDPGLIVEI